MRRVLDEIVHVWSVSFTAVKLNLTGSWMVVKVLAGTVVLGKSPCATCLFVSVSKTWAWTREKCKGRKLLFESICKIKLVLKLKFAGVREKATLPLPFSGVSWLNAKLGTRGMVKASVIPMTTQTPNRIQTNNRRVSHLMPQNPCSSRRNERHLAASFSLRSSRFPDLVMARSSDAFHSPPRAGTVMSSTGPVPDSDPGVSGFDAPTGI